VQCVPIFVFPLAKPVTDTADHKIVVFYLPLDLLTPFFYIPRVTNDLSQDPGGLSFFIPPLSPFRSLERACLLFFYWRIRWTRSAVPFFLRLARFIFGFTSPNTFALSGCIEMVVAIVILLLGMFHLASRPSNVAPVATFSSIKYSSGSPDPDSFCVKGSFLSWPLSCTSFFFSFPGYVSYHVSAEGILSALNHQALSTSYLREE